MVKPYDRRAILLSSLIVGVAAVIGGCRNSADSLPALAVYEVKGRVLLADGKPLDGGWIYFVPKGDLPLTPSAEIGSDGTFSLTTGGSGAGAPPGDYKIRVETPQLPAPRKGQRPRVPSQYNDEDSSGIVVTVRAQANQLDPIVLK
jgi:hypothetical protein